MSNEASDYILSWLDEQAMQYDEVGEPGSYAEGVRFTVAASLMRGFRTQVLDLTKTNQWLKEELDSLANFNPDWDMLQASRSSLREHMKANQLLRNDLMTAYDLVQEGISGKPFYDHAARAQHFVNKMQKYFSDTT